MVPANCLDDVADTGAGFAGAALWGMGQGPHSHDMMARVDLDTYTPLPWAEGVARFASDLYVDDAPHPFCPRVNLKRVLAQARGEGYLFNVGVEPEHFLVVKNPDGSIVPVGPRWRRRAGEALLRLQGPLRGHGLPAGDDGGPERPWLGCVPVRPRGCQRPVRNQLRVHRRLDYG